MRIWLGTWNVEQRFPTPIQITEWLNHANGTAGAYANCDVIAMTFQECSRQHAQPTIGGFAALNHLTAFGQTKNQENCQAMFIWRRNGPGGAGDVQGVGPGQNDVTTRTFKRKVKFWAEYGKGSCTNVVWYRENGEAMPWGIVISGAHLDSKSAAKRTAQVRAAETAADQLTAPNPNGFALPWTVQFLMGDLNFRVNKYQGTWGRDNFYGTIASHRRTLFANDGLALDPVLGGAGWTFPEPVQGVPGLGAQLQLPSYKRHYKSATAAAQARNAALALEINPGASAHLVPQLFDIPLDDKGHVKEGAREGQFDFGWLDRIGYRVRAGSGRNVTHVYAGSASHLVVSDHAAVYSVFDIT